MGVQVIESGKLVKIEPDDRVTPQEILEFAEELIKTDGWNKSVGLDASIVNTPQGGWTLHGAVGEAARRSATEPSAPTYRQKDYASHDQTHPGARELRDDVDTLLMQVHGKTDIEINDVATSVDEVLAASRLARGADPVAV